MSQKSITGVDHVDIRERNDIDEVLRSVDVDNRILDTTVIDNLDKRERMKFLSINDIKVGYEVSYGRVGYKHHAVVVSVDTKDKVYEIIHLSGDSSDSFMASSSSGDGKASPIMQSKTMEETLRQKSYYYRYDEHVSFTGNVKLSFDPTVIKARAFALIRVFKAITLDYHLRKFNCHHFASYCITGIPFCKKYRKEICGFERGKAFNEEAKITLDGKLKQFFEREREDEPVGNNDKKKPTTLLDPENASTMMTKEQQDENKL